jgi:hypothetical protein
MAPRRVIGNDAAHTGDPIRYRGVNDRSRSTPWAAPISALLGGSFFAWLVGGRVLDPTEASWVLRGDWQWHFLGWHFFRNEPWHLPPGIVSSYLEPIGTALGYTDSIPLVAITLKPFAGWLPNPFNYLGLWFLLNYILQGFFGALVVGTWTPRPGLRVLGGGLLVLMPTMLARMAHPALASHWLLLWALWLNWREPKRYAIAQQAALGLISGLVHPYLAVMVLALLLPTILERVVAWPIALASVVTGWWASGLFTIRSSADLQSSGLGDFSMNLLGPVTPAGRSLFLPDLPVVSLEQIGEGYQYLGVGVLFLCVTVGITCLARRCRPDWRALPLFLILVACSLYAMSPRVTFGSSVVLDLVDEVGALSFFRSTGRFFWPVAYALTAASAGFVAARFKARIAGAVLAAAVILQLIDLQKFFLTLHNGSRDPAFFVWSSPLQSAEWGQLLPKYRHVRMYSPEICGGATPVPFVHIAYLAGIYGLGINDGFAARLNRARQQEECARLGREFRNGILDTTTVYLVAPSFLPEFEERTKGAASCHSIDGVPVCVAARSTAREGS